MVTGMRKETIIYSRRREKREEKKWGMVFVLPEITIINFKIRFSTAVGLNLNGFCPLKVPGPTDPRTFKRKGGDTWKNFMAGIILWKAQSQLLFLFTLRLYQKNVGFGMNKLCLDIHKVTFFPNLRYTIGLPFSKNPPAAIGMLTNGCRGY